MGEFELLARIRARLPQPGPQVRLGSGDDAAITVPGGATATSVDALIDGVHFRREWSSLAQIGAKALAVALSDLAAMGATAGEAYVVLGIPTDLDEDGCIELLDGIMKVAEETGTTLAGGDVARAPALTLAMTVVGHAKSVDDLVTRAGARPGDSLVVTGELGGAAAGLLLLEDQAKARSRFGSHSAPNLDRSLIRRQLEPRPRLEAGQALAAAGATAMIDLSDGLGGDANHLARGSGVCLRIDAKALPLADGITDLTLAVSGGEDYELLATIPPDRVAAIPATLIGTVVAGEGVEIRLPGGELLEPKGYDQLG